MAKDIFQFSIRVYYEDTDFTGVVYHAQYLHFFERARTEWLRSLDIHHHKLAEDGLAFVVRRLEIDYQRPAKIDDELFASAELIGLRGPRIELKQVLTRHGEVLSTANVTIVVIDANGRPCRVPEAMKLALS